MSLPGIVGTLRLAGTLVIALPIALFGTERLVAGDPWGVAFVALAALVIVLERVLVNPLDPADLFESTVERAGGRFVGGRSRRERDARGREDE